MTDTNSIGDRLLAFIERIERLQEEIKALRDDVAEVKKEARHAGFDVKTITEIIRKRAMTDVQRREQEELLDIYMHAIGMAFDDTPLGESARRRLAGTPPPLEGDDADDEHSTAAPAAPATPPPEQKQETPEVDEAQAAALGTKAAEEGKPVTDNPFPAGDPRRAIWDQAWCAHSGSDGMDIPEAWRRKKPDEKKGPDPDDLDPDDPGPDDEDPANAPEPSPPGTDPEPPDGKAGA